MHWLHQNTNLDVILCGIGETFAVKVFIVKAAHLTFCLFSQFLCLICQY